MRWNDGSAHTERSERCIRKFLIWPTKIDGETRWLEFATIVQMYYVGAGWINWRWK